MRGEPSKARRHSWIYMETESGQHQRRTRGIGADGQIDIYLNVKQMQQFPGLLVKFIVGWIYCFCARLECTDRKPLVKQFIEEACVQMWPMKYIKITMMTKHIIEDCNGADDDRGGDVEKTNVWNILDPRKCSHIWCKTREPAITSSLTHALPILLIIHRVFSSTCKRKWYVCFWHFSFQRKWKRTNIIQGSVEMKVLIVFDLIWFYLDFLASQD